MVISAMAGRCFELHRSKDITGVSGTGVVADGVQWPDGTVTIRWRGEYASLVHWQSIEHVVRIHGHDGATEVIWQENEKYGREIRVRAL
jgi:hypothetical protein